MKVEDVLLIFRFSLANDSSSPGWLPLDVEGDDAAPPPLMGGARVYNCLLLLLCHPHNTMEQSLEPVSTKGAQLFDSDLAVKQTLISVDKKTEDAGRFLEEPLLKENPNRFVLFPIQDNEVRLCVYIYIYIYFYNL